MRKFMVKQDSNDSIRVVYDDFIRRCEVKNFSQYTIRYYNGVFHIFELFYDIEQQCDTLNQKIWEEFVLHLRKSDIKDATMISYLKGMKTIFYFMMNKGYIKEFKISIPKVDKQLKEVYTHAEIQKLIKKPNIKQCTFAEYRAWVMVSYFVSTGQRMRTVLNIKIEDLDLQNHLVHLNIMKNRKQTILPLSKGIVDILIEYLQYRGGNNDDYLFCKYNGKQMTKTGLGEAIRLYNKARGVDKTSVHLFRHYFAKEYLMAGGDVFRLQRLMCHSDINVTKEYLNLCTKDLEQDFTAYNPLDTLLDKQISMRIK